MVSRWYRVMSPHIDIDVKSVGEPPIPPTLLTLICVVYDTAQNILILDIVQKFHIFLSPFAPAPARYVPSLSQSCLLS